MKKKTLRELKQELARHDERYVKLTEDVRSKKAKIEALSKELADLEKKRKNEASVWMVVYEQTIAKRSFPREVVYLRKQLAAVRENLNPDVLTARAYTAAAAQCRTDEKRIVAHLQEVCDHRFVFNYAGYVDSYPAAYEDPDNYYGRRICPICGFSEESQEYGEPVYDVLCKQDERVIKTDLRPFPGSTKWRYPSSVNPSRLPLALIQNVFYLSACTALTWPDDTPEEYLMK